MLTLATVFVEWSWLLELYSSYSTKKTTKVEQYKVGLINHESEC